MNNINDIQNNLNKLIETNIKGAAIRSRARWKKSGKKMSNNFLIWKNKMQKKSIKSLCYDQGILTDKQEDILRKLAIFYQSFIFENRQYWKKDCCDYSMKKLSRYQV